MLRPSNQIYSILERLVIWLSSFLMNSLTKSCTTKRTRILGINDFEKKSSKKRSKKQSQNLLSLKISIDKFNSPRIRLSSENLEKE
jgi:hypothetical protein